MKIFFKLIAVILLIFASSNYTQAREIVNVDINSSVYVNIGREVIRVTSGNPSIAVVKKIDPDIRTGFLVEGHGAGTTNILVWTANGRIQEYLIVVSPEDVGQSLLIQRAIGLPNVRVKKIGSKILLMGTVENQYERNYAIQIASFYAGVDAGGSINTGSNVSLGLTSTSATDDSADDVELGEIQSNGDIVDLLKMLHPTQVRLEAQVIDINSDDSKNLGIQYGYGSGTTIAPGVMYAGESYGGGTSFRNNPLKWFDSNRSSIFMSLQALIDNNKARVLSRPSVTTLSGEQATIQIGGQVPYTTSNLNGTTVSFKDYGIILQFRPVVDAENRITAAVHAEVSNLSGQSVDGQPIIATRHAESVVHLDSGSSMVIGGLMDSTEGKSVQKIPLLGDIPIIGEFFKYSYKSRSKRELIIIITPTIVETDDPARMTEEMEGLYTQGNQAVRELREVDVNSTPEDEFEDEFEDEVTR